MISYIKNNIEFRIVAAKALEAFKNSQAFMLNEVNKSEFGLTAKEILLLQYDTWFQWCLFAERFCLKHKRLTEDHIGMLIIDAITKYQKNFELMRVHSEVFDVEIVRIYEQTHRYLMDFFSDKMNTFIGKESAESYPLMIHSLTGVLNATLFELHEIDSLVRGTDFPFISLDSVGVEYYKQKQISIPAERYKLYKENFNDLKKIVLKCYVEYEDNELITKCGVTPIEAFGANVTSIAF